MADRDFDENEDDEDMKTKTSKGELADDVTVACRE